MRFCYALLIAAFLFSCISSNKGKASLEKIWIFDEDRVRSGNTDDLKYGNLEYNFTSASFLNLQKDGNFTSNFTAFDHGTWQLQDSTLVLINQKNIRLPLDIKQLRPSTLICVNKRNNRVYRFIGYTPSYTSDDESPFSIASNQWRIKARKKETDVEIAARLKNHFKFWEKYFQWGLDTKLEVLDITSTPSVLDMYANGFKLRYFDEQSPDWQNIFYDSANCWRAYEMVYYQMYEKKINWPKTENRFETFVSAFKQLQQWMDTDPKTYLPDSTNKAAIKKD